MRLLVKLFIIVSAPLLACGQAFGQDTGCVPQPCAPALAERASSCGVRAPELDDAVKHAVVDSLATAIRQRYVYPARAEGLISAIEERLEGGSYGEATTAVEFARALTADLHEISDDLHFMVALAARGDGAPTSACPSVCDPEGKRPPGVCVRDAKRLAGNVGYFKMEIFENPSIGVPAIDAAMKKLAGAAAYIVDLRDSPGGHHDMITAVASYFLAPGTEIHTLHRGAQGTSRRVRTHAPTGGAARTEAPLYILTSGKTGSSAEALAYDLKHLGRAVTVGEATVGTGHCAEQQRFDLPGFVLDVRVPVHEVIHPVTGTNWEGAGVEPDIAVPAADALVEALRLVQESS